MVAKHEMIAEDADAGRRVDRFLAGSAGKSRSRIKALIKRGYLKVGNHPVTDPSAKVITGAKYRLTIPAPLRAEPESENIPLDVVFEDEHLIVLNKPAGLTVHPAVGNRAGTLVNALLHHCGDSLSGIGGFMRPGIVHRIDKDTSGLLVAAKNDRAHQELAKQFAGHSVTRSYICFTRGVPNPRKGRIENRIGRARSDRKKMAVFKDPDAYELLRLRERGQALPGKIAITHYKFLEGFGQQKGASVGTPLVSRIECRIKTGRTHQIRVHMAHAGCPLLGDRVYGKTGALKCTNTDAEHTLRLALKPFLRQALHAATLGFIHPATGKNLLFESDLPGDMAELESNLGVLK